MAVYSLRSLERRLSGLDGATLEVRPENSPELSHLKSLLGRGMYTKLHF